MDYKKYKGNNNIVRNLVTFPLIWAVFPALLLLDLILELYHRICFPLYSLKYVKRKEFIRFDRYKLPYLPWYDKLHCLYCEYANGFIHYASEIIGVTETYWCGIKHEDNGKPFNEPRHHKNFVSYGNEKEFKAKYCKMQKPPAKKRK